MEFEDEARKQYDLAREFITLLSWNNRLSFDEYTLLSDAVDAIEIDRGAWKRHACNPQIKEIL